MEPIHRFKFCPECGRSILIVLNDNKKGRFTHMSDGYYAVGRDDCYEDQNEEMCGEAIDRLADFENTGFEPSEIRDFVERFQYAAEWARLAREKGADKFKEILAAYDEGRVVLLKPDKTPSKDGSEKPPCFYSDPPGKDYCSAYGCGDGNDEPIDACKNCWWWDGNEDFRAGR